MPRYSRPPLAVVPSATVLAACFWVSRPLAALTAASACCLTAAASCLARRDLRALLDDLDGRLHARVDVAVDRVGAGLGELDRHRLGLLARQPGLDRLGAGVGELLAVAGGREQRRVRAHRVLAVEPERGAGGVERTRRPSGRWGRGTAPSRRPSSGMSTLWKPAGMNAHRITGGDGQLAREERVRDGGLTELLGRGRGRSDVHVFRLGLCHGRYGKRDRGGCDHGAEGDHAHQQTPLRKPKSSIPANCGAGTGATVWITDPTRAENSISPLLAQPR